MKGYLRWFSIAGLLASLIGLALSGNSGAGFAQAQSATSPSTQEVENATASLTVIEGQVFVQRAGSEDWQPVAEAVTVAAGDTVWTGADGRAILTFFEGSESVLDPGTEMTVETLRITENQPFDIKLRLWLGSTWHSVQKFYGSESRYEVDTPSATLVARGTKWWVSVDDQGHTRAKIIEGKVDIQGQWTEGVPPDKALHDEIVKTQESKEASPSGQVDITGTPGPPPNNGDGEGGGGDGKGDGDHGKGDGGHGEGDGGHGEGGGGHGEGGGGHGKGKH